MQIKMSLSLAITAFAGFMLGIAAQEAQEIQIPSNGTFVGRNYQGDNVTYTLAPTVWELEYSDIIPKHNFTGSVQELYAYINTTFPEYHWPINELTAHTSPEDIFMSEPSLTTTTTTVATADPTNDPTVTWPAAHKPYETGRVVCGHFPRADWFKVRDGYNYLDGVPGQPGLPPGPAVCARVSCSFNVGIWWCNDNPITYFVGDFGMIADMARQIAQDTWQGGCTYRLGAWWTMGQNFHENGWNVIAAKLAAGETC
ncbi:hypothetical protein N0V82_006090 [Gnomoniopsis sp. IMI 355080]|nr:hypothetical protein N0V82_006090 [Gnomoniopsis sp. IMI 355080]